MEGEVPKKKEKKTADLKKYFQDRYANNSAYIKMYKNTFSIKRRYNIDEKDITTYRHYLYNVIKIKELMDDLPDEIIEKFLSEREILNFSLKK
tara:strand:+ start:309 stop:587 length:279 start_codon:yes stop_codon:yes gene_type:complete